MLSLPCESQSVEISRCESVGVNQSVREGGSCLQERAYRLNVLQVNVLRVNVLKAPLRSTPLVPTPLVPTPLVPTPLVPTSWLLSALMGQVNHPEGEGEIRPVEAPG
jgi:hypothetical protein